MSTGAQPASGIATYRILRELGARSQRSYAAIREPHELVVVHRYVRKGAQALPGTITLSPEELGLLLRDAQCLAKNWHPNIARIKHVDFVNGDLTIASELVEGSTLADLFELARAGGNGFALDVLVRVLLDVLAGIHGIHGLRDARNVPIGAIHGELCPANIVVGRDGVARVVNALRPRPLRIMVGSEGVGHAAPEVLDGGAVDGRADVHAVGVILWEALAGKRLHDEQDPARVLSRQREIDIPRPTLPSGSPYAALADIAMRALAFDPALRFRTAASMAAELRKLPAARIATGSAVASRVLALDGERIRRRRVQLDPSSSGSRRRASDDAIAAAEAKKTEGTRASSNAVAVSSEAKKVASSPLVAAPDASKSERKKDGAQTASPRAPVAASDAKMAPKKDERPRAPALGAAAAAAPPRPAGRGEAGADDGDVPASIELVEDVTPSTTPLTAKPERPAQRPPPPVPPRARAPMKPPAPRTLEERPKGAAVLVAADTAKAARPEPIEDRSTAVGAPVTIGRSSLDRADERLASSPAVLSAAAVEDRLTVPVSPAVLSAAAVEGRLTVPVSPAVLSAPAIEDRGTAPETLGAPASAAARPGLGRDDGAPGLVGRAPVTFDESEPSDDLARSTSSVVAEPQAGAGASPSEMSLASGAGTSAGVLESLDGIDVPATAPRKRRHRALAIAAVLVLGGVVVFAVRRAAERTASHAPPAPTEVATISTTGSLVRSPRAPAAPTSVGAVEATATLSATASSTAAPADTGETTAPGTPPATTSPGAQPEPSGDEAPKPAPRPQTKRRYEPLGI